MKPFVVKWVAALTAAVMAVSPMTAAAKMFVDSTPTPAKSGEAIVLFARDAAGALGLSGVQVEKTLSFGKQATVGLVTSKRYSTAALIRLLKRNRQVEQVQANRTVAVTALNDSYADYLWGLKNSGQQNGTAGADIDAQTGWDSAPASDAERVVAVVDTGIDYLHEELKNRMWQNPYPRDLAGTYGYDFANYDADPMDDNGHGTLCAGIIAAEQQNGLGVAGVDGNVRLMALKCFDETGTSDMFDILQIYDYIYKAQTLGVNVVAVNNSWGYEADPDELAAEDMAYTDEVTKAIIDLVGEKGAVSVFAAGNSGGDNDTLYAYPSNLDSAYSLSVAATDETGAIAKYSNTGETTVDVAAPGTNILSSVCYPCYNPSVYNAEKLAETTELFTNFEDKKDFGTDGVYGAKALTDDLRLSVSDQTYFGLKTDASGALRASLQNTEAWKSYLFYIPYTVGASSEAGKNSTLSMMLRPSSNRPVTVNISDVPEAAALAGDMEQISNGMVANGYLSEDLGVWEHLNLPRNSGKAGQRRAIVFELFTEEDTDETGFYLDDIGVSRMIPDAQAEAVFGKYDFQSGTSFAAPYITGAVALLSAIDPKAKAVERANRIKAMTAPLSGVTYGAFSFKNRDKLRPIVNEASSAAGSITLRGNFFGAQKGSLSVNGQTLPASALVWSDTTVTAACAAYVNRKVAVTLTNADGKTAQTEVFVRSNARVYQPLAKGECAVGDDFRVFTDGPYLYLYDSELFSFYKCTFSNEELVPEPLAMPDFDAIFAKELAENAATAAPVEPAEIVSDFCALGDRIWAIARLDLSYACAYKLICYDKARDTWFAMANLPTDAQAYRYGDNTLSVYNGKLYLVGGYNRQTGEAGTLVRSYSIQTGSWATEPSLPTGRYGSIVKQVGDKLVAVYGADSNGNIPKTAVFNGVSWSETVQPPTPETPSYLYPYERKGKYYTAECGIQKDGLIFTGCTCEQYGDTFRYSLSAGRFSPVAYTAGEDLEQAAAVSVKDKFCLVKPDDKGNLVVTYVPIERGTVLVSTSGANCKVSGAHNYMPGDIITLTVTPNKNCYIQSVHIGNTPIGTNYTCIAKTAFTVKVSAGLYVTKIKLNKTKASVRYGKKLRLKATITPKNATTKKLKWTSGNKKYLVVSSKGVVRVKKAGIGKTVKVTVRATDKKRVKAVCKVKILKKKRKKKKK